MNYWEYIRVEELLRLQGGIDDDESKRSNDEVLFIVVHQIYELWFKLVIRELTSARDLFDQNPVPDMALAQATRSFKRVTAIFEQAVSHFKVMETLTTRDYLGFRDTLIGASGFQSAQLREIEILLGLQDAQRIPLGVEGSYKEALKAMDGSASPALKRVERRLGSGKSLRDVVYAWLSRTPVSSDGPESFLRGVVAGHREEIEMRLGIVAERMKLPEADLALWRKRYEEELVFAERFLLGEEDAAATPEEREQKRHVRAALVFLESYRELPRLAWPREAIDALIEMEQTMVVWRQRHARMVERVIGKRTGTGGSAGVDYLDQTALRYRVFGDLWAVRTLLLRKAAVPEIENADDFRFRVEDKL
ncbi:MAG TPA: tryptophan 2,3-dioxygenase family protein [Polyangiaceae bacterium]|nr:tryptophan 2,3-dioxygenase family protein [Polyangiaceae bacterium]